jgi:hypothetical protein
MHEIPPRVSGLGCVGGETAGGFSYLKVLVVC